MNLHGFKFINHKIYMYYFSTVYLNSIPAHLTRSNWEGFFLRSVVYPVQLLRLMIGYGMAVKRLGMLGVCVRKMKALSVMIKTVILICKGR